MGSWAAHAEIHASGSYFEFEVQHLPEHVELLHRLRQRRTALFSGSVTMAGVLAFIKAEGTAAAADRIHRILGLWTRQRAYDRLLSRLGRLWTRDAAEAQGMMLEVEPVQPEMDQLPRCVHTLLGLADRRLG